MAKYKDLLNKPVTQLKKMSRNELSKIVSRLSSVANARIRVMDANFVSAYTGLKSYQEGGKFGAKGKTHKQLLREYNRVNEFLSRKTTTMKGYYERHENNVKIAKRLGLVDDTYVEQVMKNKRRLRRALKRQNLINNGVTLPNNTKPKSKPKPKPKPVKTPIPSTDGTLDDDWYTEDDLPNFGGEDETLDDEMDEFDWLHDDYDDFAEDLEWAKDILENERKVALIEKLFGQVVEYYGGVLPKEISEYVKDWVTLYVTQGGTSFDELIESIDELYRKKVMENNDNGNGGDFFSFFRTK